MNVTTMNEGNFLCDTIQSTVIVGTIMGLPETNRVACTPARAGWQSETAYAPFRKPYTLIALHYNQNHDSSQAPKGSCPGRSESDDGLGRYLLGSQVERTPRAYQARQGRVPSTSTPLQGYHELRP